MAVKPRQVWEFFTNCVFCGGEDIEILEENVKFFIGSFSTGLDKIKCNDCDLLYEVKQVLS